MALHYDITACPHKDAIREMPGSLQCVTFFMMFVGIGKLDAKNLPEFKTRVRMFEAACGPMTADGTPLPADVIDQFEGIRTNVTDTSIAAFHKDLTRRMREQAKDALRREAAKAQKEDQA